MRVIFTILFFITAFIFVKTPSFALATTSVSKQISPQSKIAMDVEGKEAKGIIAFKDWKSEMIETAQSRLQISKTNLEAYKAMNPPKEVIKNTAKSSSKTRAEDLDPQIEKYSDQVQADESYLAFTKDLTVSDYFVGYLVKQNNPQQAYKQAAQKLTSDEVAELLGAYAANIKESNASSTSSQPKNKIPVSASDQLPL